MCTCLFLRPIMAMLAQSIDHCVDVSAGAQSLEELHKLCFSLNNGQSESSGLWSEV